jgi:hypothetical protein
MSRVERPQLLDRMRHRRHLAAASPEHPTAGFKGVVVSRSSRKASYYTTPSVRPNPPTCIHPPAVTQVQALTITTTASRSPPQPTFLTPRSPIDSRHHVLLPDQHRQQWRQYSYYRLERLGRRWQLRRCCSRDHLRSSSTALLETPP